MPDITMCKDNRCPFSHDCYRFTAKEDGLQSYFLESPLNVKKGSCEYQMNLGADMPVEHKAVDFADKLIELILQYEIGNATFEKAKVIIERKHVWAEVNKKKAKRMKASGNTYGSGAACTSTKRRQPTVTLSLDDACTS